MGDKRTRFGRFAVHRLAGDFGVRCLGVVYACLMTIGSAAGQVATPVHESNSAARLLNLEEGRSIVNVAWQEDLPKSGMRDCSHVVHQIYEDAGFEYPYASSFEIYAGNGNFVRVKYAHAGDLVAWRGHVGIVVDPVQHSFYSLVRTGLEQQDYRAPYWRSRGTPRFYRYKVEAGGVVRTATKAGSAHVLNGHTSRAGVMDAEEQKSFANASSGQPVIVKSMKSEASYEPPVPHGLDGSKRADPAFEIPASVVVGTGNHAPTREEVAEGISEVSEAMGSALPGESLFKSRAPVEIVEKFEVEKVSVKHDRGWARVAVNSAALIDSGAIRVKRQHEKARWQLRRTESGWEAVSPTDRIYISRDVAVKHLAANLAQLANSEGAAEHQQAVLQQESQLASLLNALLETKHN